MTRARIYLTLFFAVCLAVAVPVTSAQPRPESEPVVETVGNFSFIHLRLRGRPNEYSPLILSILDKLEKDHCVKVLSYCVEKQQRVTGGSLDNITFGIWVTHEPSQLAPFCKPSRGR